MPKVPTDQIPVQQLMMPKYLITTGKLLNRLSPFLAARFAARLFITPYRYQLPNREKRMFESSVKEKILVETIQQEIQVYHFGTSEKKVLLVHGWSGTGTQLSGIANQLLKNDFSTISFDAPAHGKSPGKTSMMPYFIESIHELEKKYGPFEAAIGHSLGGMSLLRAIKEGLILNKLVIIGTANSITAIIRNFVENMGMGNKASKLMKAYFDNKFGENLDNYSGATSAKKVSVPTLVIHDKNDVDVHYSAATEIVNELENGTLLVTEKLGHRKILGNPFVIEKIVDFIKNTN